MFRKDWEKALEEKRQKKATAPSSKKMKKKQQANVASLSSSQKGTKALARTGDGGKRAIYQDSDEED